MAFARLLIANRGEIAIRIARTAADLALRTVAAYAEDDARSLHVKATDEAVALKGAGARAYLDIDAVVAAAKGAGCDVLHPGYGFLSENAALARACAAAGIAFVGPSPQSLEAFGDKARARALAISLGIPVVQGTEGAACLADTKAFFAGLPKGSAMMIKAVAGGGGRGMRVVRRADEIETAYAAASREAEGAFGHGSLYAERLIDKARHIEVQIAGDGKRVVAVGERDCSLQRRHQKIVEIAPAPNLNDDLRKRLHAASEKLGEAVHYKTVGTIEFLVDAATGSFAFIEANARLQVEHTITEEVTGIDLVRAQLELAAGHTLTDIGLGEAPRSRGFAIQARVNMETMSDSGQVKPSGGRIGVYEPPSGPGIRVDGYGYAGYMTSPSYDSLLAKVIARGSTFAEAAARTGRALGEFRIGGVETNERFLRAVLAHPTVLAGNATTRFIEEDIKALLKSAAALPRRDFDDGQTARVVAVEMVEGAVAVTAPLQATVTAIDVREGDLVRKGQPVAILEAMKMEHVVEAVVGGRVVRVGAKPGDVLLSEQPFLFIAPEEIDASEQQLSEAIDLDHIRPDLAEVHGRWRITLDEARPDATAARRKVGQRTARENVDDLVDPGSFVEYGAFGLASQRARRTEEQLMKMSPADGLITGIGSINGALFPPEKSSAVALAYDYTVFAGTQGRINHRKTDRILQVSYEQKLPVVWYCEGGGGRPGETEDQVSPTHTFSAYAQLSGVVPKIAIVSRYCFAGNASIAGMSEILIATKNTNIGMAGPSMIEGGGMGLFKPTEIGPMSVQTRNGVVDIVAEDEADATRLAKRALSYFQGDLKEWTVADQRLLRRAIPENRLRVYEVRPLIETLVDTGSFLEIRRDFAPGMITGFFRLEGRPMGLIANDQRYLGGAIDCDGSDKSTRFLQLCDAFDIPVLSLIDTPGYMVGLESEAQAAVRKTSRMFIAGRKLGVPFFAVVLRKCYGLGAIGMTGGSAYDPMFMVSWPTGEFGGMNLEGFVRLGYRRELEAETDPVKQKALYEKLLAEQYAIGKAIVAGTYLKVDAVIDPMDTRRWLIQGLRASPKRRGPPSRLYVDTW